MRAKDIRLFNKFLKQNGAYDAYYHAFNSLAGNRYRGDINISVDEYLNDRHTDVYISRAFGWADFPGISWNTLHYDWFDYYRNNKNRIEKLPKHVKTI